MLGRRKTPRAHQRQDARDSSRLRLLPDPNRVDRAVLSALLFEPASGPWAIDELARELGMSLIEVDDSAWRLSRTGVVHRLGARFVVVSRAAAHAAALLDPESKRASFT
jgi:hypothetical protein